MGDVYVRGYEAKAGNHESFAVSHAEYRNALEALYRSVLELQLPAYRYYAKNFTFRLERDIVKWDGWDALLDEIREQERVFTAVSTARRDMKYRRLLQKGLRPGTSEWLLHGNEKFKAWQDSPSSRLFAHKGEQNAATMLGALVKQICSRRPNKPQPIKDLEQYKERGERPGVETLEAALAATVRGFSAVHIVIDGLNECPALAGSEESFLKALTASLLQHPAASKSFIPAGRRPTLTQPSAACCLHRSWSEGVKKEARERLIEKAEGVFHFVVVYEYDDPRIFDQFYHAKCRTTAWYPSMTTTTTIMMTMIMTTTTGWRRRLWLSDPVAILRPTPIERLLDYVADVNKQGGRFGSAWHAAAAADTEYPQWEKLMRLLLSRGRVEIIDARGDERHDAQHCTLSFRARIRLGMRSR
ncbi:uncharacterized protein B0T15DRAFT_572567 [Chaetomium strumarium]|uniref:Uncharacterized protein n=1 Tax=Chaetomium strumarium TaxID=1170767 RepID=A0AAJ0GYA5_9PEZI|nr:hypothetical protein B0T15DRAFT_572567 [Chaetomium strumarium]